MSGRISQTFRSSPTSPLRKPAVANVKQAEQEEVEETSFVEDNGTYEWSMSGGFICRHHEVHRSKQYVPSEETFSILF